MNRKTANNILLTGAGFTKDFGGFLAEEMWSKIFNNIKNQPRIKKLCIADYDYESIYYKVISEKGKYENGEKQALRTAIFTAYQELDKSVRTEGSPPANRSEVCEFIKRFAGSAEEEGFFFTLNQDLFIECYFKPSDQPVFQPGVKNISTGLNFKQGTHPLDPDKDFISLPIEGGFERKCSRAQLNYIKLHGSYGWKSSDHSDKLVIGKNKEDQIADEPVLSWYFKQFKEVLFGGNRKLFVIGYGFRDDHINEVIAKAIDQYGLKIYVLSPAKPFSFIDQLNKIKHGKEILFGLLGYFPHNLSDVFPSDQSESHGWREIEATFFVN